MRGLGVVEHNLSLWGDTRLFVSALAELEAKFVVCPLDLQESAHMRAVRSLASQCSSIYGLIKDSQLIPEAKQMRLSGIVLADADQDDADRASRLWAGPVWMLTRGGQLRLLTSPGEAAMVIDPRGDIPQSLRPASELQQAFTTAHRLGFGVALEHIRTVVDAPELWHEVCAHPWRET